LKGSRLGLEINVTKTKSTRINANQEAPKNCGEERRGNPPLTPYRVENGDRLAKPYAESRQASPAKPWTHRETEERKTMFDMEKDSTS